MQVRIEPPPHGRPWWTIIGGKLILSRLPLSIEFWRRAGLFKHGNMLTPEYAIGVFENHFNRVEFARKREGFVVVELGPGDSIFTALIANAHGASKSYLIDAGAYSSQDLDPLRVLARELKARGLAAPDLGGTESI